VAGVVLVSALTWTVWPAAPTTVNTGPQTAATTSPETQTVQQTSTEGGETVWIRFRYTNSEADSVAVAGDFSQWDPVALSPREVDGKTVWTGLVPVSRGEHEYQFLINGERWVTDPLAPVKRSDGFGAKNAVLNI
jgi:1,4-alpha-glucan branching enzyme